MRTSFEFEEEHRTLHVRADGCALHAIVRRPLGRGPFACVLDLHGGAWSHFGPSIDFALCESLTRLGHVTVALDFRLAPEHPWPAMLDDARIALAWIADHANALDVDPRAIGAVGASSGGHLAAMLGLEPRPAHREAGPSLAFVVGLYPILDVPARRHMVEGARFRGIDAWAERFATRRLERSSGRGSGDPTPRLRALDRLRTTAPRLGDALTSAIDRTMERAFATTTFRAFEYPSLRRAHATTFEDDATELGASPRHSVEQRRAQHLPPMLVLAGARDPNVPVASTRAFAEAYEEAGGTIDLRVFDRLAHGFASIPSPALDRAVTVIDAFIRSSAPPDRAGATIDGRAAGRRTTPRRPP